MNYTELIKSYKKKGYALKSYGDFSVRGKKYTFYKIKIDNRAKKTFLITTGFHGEEFNGPISLLNLIDEVVALAREKKLNLIIYPCVNPSGFDLHQRYNAKGESPNNDFLRYEILPGQWTDVLRPASPAGGQKKFLQYKIIEPSATESRLLLKDLQAEGLLTKKIPVATLDIHQDDELPFGDFYAYILDRRATYQKIMKKVDAIGSRARSASTFVYRSDQKLEDWIDDDGFITVHDGTFTDMMYRLGSKYVVCAETGNTVPLPKVRAINKIFIEEMMDLAARG